MNTQPNLAAPDCGAEQAHLPASASAPGNRARRPGESGRRLGDLHHDLYRLEAALRVLHGYVDAVAAEVKLPNSLGPDLAFQLCDMRELAGSLAAELAGCAYPDFDMLTGQVAAQTAAGTAQLLRPHVVDVRS